MMIRRDGYAKLLDFGLAKLTEKKKADEASLEDATKAFVNTNERVLTELDDMDDLSERRVSLVGHRCSASDFRDQQSKQ